MKATIYCKSTLRRISEKLHFDHVSTDMCVDENVARFKFDINGEWQKPTPCKVTAILDLWSVYFYIHFEHFTVNVSEDGQGNRTYEVYDN